ncbi:MAG: ImmA/IrrE family metallo-endopeptidase [Chloroflexi bacterium]|nr:ImmA/IrrE family metallo-endopeptidase [Chloroflexota bacterium]
MTADTWAKQLIDALPAEITAGLRAEPHAVLEGHFKLKLNPVASPPQRGHRGWCDGFSILEDQTIFYVTTRGRRENFTLLHELGHFLTDESLAFINWVADLTNTDEVIEMTCDRIAARLLLPGAFVEQTMAGAVSASGLLRLYRESAASRHACAIAASERLGCPGFIAIIERASGLVSSAARVADTRPAAWRDDLLPAGHPLWQIDPSKPMSRRASWPHSDGTPSEYWLDAVADERYIYAIFAAVDLWAIDRFHGTDVVEGRVSTYEATVHCRCGFNGKTRRYPCPDCRRPYCPSCDKCECVRRAYDSKVCPGCHLSLHRSQMKQGACAECIKRGKVKI